MIDMHSTIAAYRGPRPQLPISTAPVSTAQVSTQQPAYVPERGLSAENRRLREELARARKNMSQGDSQAQSVNYREVENNSPQPVFTQPAPVAPVEYKAEENNTESTDIVQRLSTLKTLCDKQLITNQECDAKRREILEQF